MLLHIPPYFQLKLAAGHLMWDFTTLREIVDTVPGNTNLQNKALVTANKIMNAFKSGDPENVKRMRGIAEDVFGKGWHAKGDKIYNEGPKKAQVVGISYCHIVSYYLRSQVVSNMLCFNRIQHGCGLIQSLSRRQQGPGLPRLIWWNVIQNIDLPVLKPNNSNGLRRCAWLFPLNSLTHISLLHSNILRFLNVSRRKWHLANFISLVVRGLRTTEICLQVKPSSGNSYTVKTTSNHVLESGVRLLGSRTLLGSLRPIRSWLGMQAWNTSSHRSWVGMWIYELYLQSSYGSWQE